MENNRGYFYEQLLNMNSNIDIYTEPVDEKHYMTGHEKVGKYRPKNPVSKIACYNKLGALEQEEIVNNISFAILIEASKNGVFIKKAPEGMELDWLVKCHGVLVDFANKRLLCSGQPELKFSEFNKTWSIRISNFISYKYLNILRSFAKFNKFPTYHHYEMADKRYIPSEMQGYSEKTFCIRNHDVQMLKDEGWIE